MGRFTANNEKYIYRREFTSENGFCWTSVSKIESNAECTSDTGMNTLEANEAPVQEDNSKRVLIIT